MSGDIFTVSVVRSSKWAAKMTLHRVECPVLGRAKEVRPGYLSGWVADGRAVVRGLQGWAETPASIGANLASERGLPMTHEGGTLGEVTQAALHTEQARRGHREYLVCGRCKPDQHPEVEAVLSRSV